MVRIQIPVAAAGGGGGATAMHSLYGFGGISLADYCVIQNATLDGTVVEFSRAHLFKLCDITML